MIANAVKLVIWDLDDTFWRGTLTEGPISPVARNHEIIAELSRRGIVNSICSKNDQEAAKAKLVELGQWDWFVFPTISFNPKGQAIAQMIEGAALRAENVLFIDDNQSNLEEAKFFNPGIMAMHPDEVLDTLLDHSQCRGKSDPELSRLNQYRLLQKKVDEKSASALSNEEFLRASDIRVKIDYDIDANFDRIVELINRANQLNYTKRRLEKPRQVDKFRELINETFGINAGCVHASDKYGDYGLIGFFLMRRLPRGSKLIHFVFSCRTMNMGIEQYIYEMLGCPRLEVVEPVSYPVQNHPEVDWINRESGEQSRIAGSSGQKLVLLGGCDLLQLASYCSADRLEFVNRLEGEGKVYYEDPGFIMGDRSAIRESSTLRKIGSWSYEDSVRFDDGLASAGLVLLSMWPAMNGEYFVTDDGADVRLNTKEVPRIRAQDPEWFERHLNPVALEDDGRLERIAACFDAVRTHSRPDCHVFIMGISTVGDIHGKQEERRKAYNEMCRAYCDGSERFHFVDFDRVVPQEYLVNGIHFSRQGYFEIAQHILANIGNASTEPQTALSAVEQPPAEQIRALA